MQRFVARQNIQHFKEMLAAESDPGRRILLESMIAEEEAKLMGSGGDVTAGDGGEGPPRTKSGEVDHAQQQADLTQSPKR